MSRKVVKQGFASGPAPPTQPSPIRSPDKAEPGPKADPSPTIERTRPPKCRTQRLGTSGPKSPCWGKIIISHRSILASRKIKPNTVSSEPEPRLSQGPRPSSNSSMTVRYYDSTIPSDHATMIECDQATRIPCYHDINAHMPTRQLHNHKHHPRSHDHHQESPHNNKPTEYSKTSHE
jgi:hypothetical protein